MPRSEHSRRRLVPAGRLGLVALVMTLLAPGVAPAHDVSAGVAQRTRLISPIEGSEPVAAKAAATAPEPPLVPTPRATCGPGAWPETGIQGRVSRGDHEKGLAARGFRCNTELVGSLTKEPPNLGTVGGYKVLRYVDHKGNECAYYDTSLLPPSNAPDLTTGVRVVNMADPAHPQLSTILTTPAMESPHESLILNEKRGVLAAVAGNLSQAVLPGIVDLYDISEDCLHPALRSSTPTGVYGHESGMAPDGKTFYSASFSTGTLVAVDITNLSVPVPVWFGRYESHGLSLSDDGTRAYLAKDANSGTLGMTVLDTTQVQNRVPNPQVPERSFLTWKGISIPQSTVPITVAGHPYVIESDEFGAQVQTGGARIIDIGDDAHPQVISNMRLEVMQPENFAAQAGDPGVDTPFKFAQGYTGHFCNVPTRVDPPIVACGMAVSGLRIFDIRDPHHPREVAYYNAPVKPRTFPEGSNWAYSQPAFAPERKEVWYSDAFTGFYAVRLTNGAWPDGKGAGPSAGATRGCISRRFVRVHVRGIRGATVRRLTVYVNGKRTKVSTGPGRSVQVKFAGTPSKRAEAKAVKIVARLRNGRTVVDRRNYRLCASRR
jgi:hypothetical protein